VPKISDEPLTKIEQTLFTSDYATLKRLYGGPGNVGVNKVIRTVVRTFVRQLTANATANIDEIENSNATRNLVEVAKEFVE
jgi:hypothetical protein